MATMSSGTFLPTYLSVVRGMPLTQAALLSSVISMVTIFSCPAGGILSDRIGSRKRPFVLGLALMAIVMPLVVFTGPAMLVVPLVAQGLIGGLVPTNIFSAGGWPLAFGSLAGMCLLGTLAGWLAKAR